MTINEELAENPDLVDFKTVVERFEITPRTLRYYEYLELIAPVRQGRSRFYSKREIARLKLILQGRRFGFKLEEIRQMLELYNPQTGNQEQIRTWLEKSEAQLDDLRSRYRELATVIADLERLQDEAREIIDES